MPVFKNEFPNEFGVTEDVRVAYLNDDDAWSFVEEPIGKGRFVGRAVQHVLDLTRTARII